MNPPCWGSETAVSLNLTIPFAGLPVSVVSADAGFLPTNVKAECAKRRWWVPAVGRSGAGIKIARKIGASGSSTAGKDDLSSWWSGRVAAGRVHRPADISRRHVAELCAAEALTAEGGAPQVEADRRPPESPMGRCPDGDPRAPLQNALPVDAPVPRRGRLRPYKRMADCFQSAPCLDPPREALPCVALPRQPMNCDPERAGSDARSRLARSSEGAAGAAAKPSCSIPPWTRRPLPQGPPLPPRIDGFRPARNPAAIPPWRGLAGVSMGGARTYPPRTRESGKASKRERERTYARAPRWPC